MEHSINLWELITLNQYQPLACPDVKRVWENASNGSRYHYQEIRLTVNDNGWVIHVFSCNSPGHITINIPAAHSMQPTITTDDIS